MNTALPIPPVALCLALAAALAGPSTASAAQGRCSQNAWQISCDHHSEYLVNPQGSYMPREVHWQVPTGQAPVGGWPAVVMFQASFFTAELTWHATKAYAYGAYYQTQVVKTLLDAGYAVVTPEAAYEGYTYWQTNIPPYAEHWSTAPDHALMLDLLDAMDDGQYGQINMGRLFATGLSSGAYMTSRMALSYEGSFQALALQSGAWATCLAYTCQTPDQMPEQHPPTLFLHGALDPIVPLSTMQVYQDALSEELVPTRVVIDPWAGHEWLPVAPSEILQWFSQWDPTR